MDKKTDKELVPLRKGISSVAMGVKDLEIKTSEDMKKAVDMLSQLNKYGDSVKVKKELLTKPLNLALKNGGKNTRVRDGISKKKMLGRNLNVATLKTRRNT